MRLQELEIRTIKKAVHSLDPDAAIYVFGSRADDSQKGGDIDLLILSRSCSPATAEIFCGQLI